MGCGHSCNFENAIDIEALVAMLQDENNYIKDKLIGTKNKVVEEEESYYKNFIISAEIVIGIISNKATNKFNSLKELLTKCYVSLYKRNFNQVDAIFTQINELCTHHIFTPIKT